VELKQNSATNGIETESEHRKCIGAESFDHELAISDFQFPLCFCSVADNSRGFEPAAVISGRRKTRE
jgi:hypothetical protein